MGGFLKMYQVITLSAIGDAETPAGGSVCIRCGLSVSCGLAQTFRCVYLKVPH